MYACFSQQDSLNGRLPAQPPVKHAAPLQTAASSSRPCPAYCLPPPPPPAAGAAPLPSNDGKKWSPEEVMELLQLVEDENYRRQRLNLDKVSGKRRWLCCLPLLFPTGCYPWLSMPTLCPLYCA